MPGPRAASSLPLEVSPPDISEWESGNSGIPYVWSYAASAPGPHVVVTAVVHGNELCGAITVDRLLRENIRPSRGTLTFGFMNVAAMLSFDPADPHGSRFVDEDFNRLWAEDVLDGDRSSAELIRAREVRPLIHEADVLLDIHSMTQMSQPLMMAGPVAKGRALARQVGIPRTIVSDSGHPQGKRMRDYSPFIDERNDRNALLVECGLHWAAASVGVAMDSTIRYLRVTGAIDDDTLPGEGTAKIEPANCFEVTEVVTVKSEQFRFEQPFQGGEVIPAKGTLLATDGDTEIRSAHDNCLIVMPAYRLVPGQTAVRLAHPVGPDQA